ncbi:MAG: AsmA protein [Paracoccaceae bacterium]|jgi:AsmA protein
MHAVLRYFLYSLIGLVALIASAVAVILFVLDPNDYKPQIEALAKEQTRLELSLQGDISWSLTPLGLELNTVSARLDDTPFLKLERLVARVGLMSLVKMQPSVHTFELEGLNINLLRDKTGSGNWERVMPESEDKKPPAAQTDASGAEGKALDFKVSHINIGNARISYRDESTGQTVTMDEFDLAASNISLGQPFPLSVQFHVVNADPQLDVRADLKTTLTTDQAIENILIDQLDSRFELAGAPFSGNEVTATLNGTVSANLKNETLSLKQVVATLATMTLKTDLTVTQYSSTPTVNGKLTIAELSLRELMKQLGQTLPPTSDPSVFTKFALSADIGGEPGRINLSAINMKLDDSLLTGKANYTLDTGAVFARLNLDKMNTDRYLPPPEPVNTAQAKPVASAAPEAESDLLPLETIRGLRLDIGLNAGQLIASEIPINQLKLLATVVEGIIQIKPLSGHLYEGTFQTTATINAQGNSPRWQLQANVADVKTLPLLTQLAEVTQFSGLANINLNVNTNGNRVSVLRKNAKGQADFVVKQGKIEGTSLAAMACQGIALTHKESIDTTSWPKITPFEDLSGAILINSDTLNNTALTAQVKGLTVQGQGLIDAQTLTLDYKAGLKILGAVDDAPACRVNERLIGAVIPVKCKGELAGENGLPCKFDTARFREALADMAKSEVKMKANEEIDRSKEKLRDKAKEKFQSLFK